MGKTDKERGSRDLGLTHGHRKRIADGHPSNLKGKRRQTGHRNSRKDKSWGRGGMSNGTDIIRTQRQNGVLASIAIGVRRRRKERSDSLESEDALRRCCVCTSVSTKSPSH